MLKYTQSRKDTIMNPYWPLVTIISLQVLFCLSLHFFLWIFLSKLILFQYTKMNCACMPQIAFFLLQEEKLCKSLNMILRKICQWKYVIWKLPLFLSLFKFDHLLNRVTTNLKKREIKINLKTEKQTYKGTGKLSRVWATPEGVPLTYYTEQDSSPLLLPHLKI